MYILEKKSIVERFPRKGVRIRVIDDKEIRDYFEALVKIIQLSSNLIEKKWESREVFTIERDLFGCTNGT